MTVPARGRLVVALSAAALVLAVTSRGELAVLALLLAVPDPTPLPLLGLTGAVVASSWRWGTTSLGALAGAQSVLGPAGGVGPTAAAAASWAAALAVVLAVGRGREPLRWVAAGATAAALVAGPGPGGDLPVRVAAGVGLVAGAAVLASWRAARPRADVAIAVLAAGAGVAAAALVVVAGDARPASIELDLVRDGLVVGLAGGAVAAVAAQLLARLPWRKGQGSPTVARPLVAPPGPTAARPR